MSIKINNMTKTAHNDAILAVCDIELEESGITKHGAKIINGKFGVFLSMPSYGEKIEGNWKFFDAIVLPKDLMKAVMKAGIEAYQFMVNDAK